MIILPDKNIKQPNQIPLIALSKKDLVRLVQRIASSNAQLEADNTELAKMAEHLGNHIQFERKAITSLLDAPFIKLTPIGKKLAILLADATAAFATCFPEAERMDPPPLQPPDPPPAAPSNGLGAPSPQNNASSEPLPTGEAALPARKDA